ncbi:MAG: hypothetical protein JSS37_10370 [Proteobacteria bacterium]|nr:hypothetical protein [Pseudomonadota bacterium]
MKDDVEDIKVYLEAIEIHHHINGEITKNYDIGGKLKGEKFRKILTEQEYSIGKFSTSLFGEKLALNNRQNLSQREITESISRYTKEYEILHIFHYLGYTDLGEDKVYVTSNGVINKDGLVENCSVDVPSTPPSDPKRIKIPETEEEKAEMINSCLGLLLVPQKKRPKNKS